MYRTFDDILIEPQFSTIKSRKDVSLLSEHNGLSLNLPVISANMDTITDAKMAKEMYRHGAAGCIHRFCTPYESGLMFDNSARNTIGSFGLGKEEQERVAYLHDAGCKFFCLDVAHGAQLAVVKQAVWFKQNYPKSFLIVGNFASESSLGQFLNHMYINDKKCKIDAVKVGVGPGSACTTRLKTGVGVPQLDAILNICREVSALNIAVIADGGMRTPGDIAKALAAGADFVMLGGMLSGTDETPGRVIYKYKWDEKLNDGRGGEVKEPQYKIYRGSASKESYHDQGKDWDCAEGESFTVPVKGPVSDVLKEIEGGLRSSLTYVGARNLAEFRSLARFVNVSSNSVIENRAHGRI